MRDVIGASNEDVSSGPVQADRRDVSVVVVQKPTGRRARLHWRYRLAPWRGLCVVTWVPQAWQPLSHSCSLSRLLECRLHHACRSPSPLLRPLH